MPNFNQKRYQHKLFIAGASFAGSIEDALNPRNTTVHQLIGNYFGALPFDENWTVKTKRDVAKERTIFKQYLNRKMLPNVDRPRSFFVGRHLLSRRILGINTPIDTTIQQAWPYVKIDLLFTGHNSQIAEKQFIGLLVAGVQTKEIEISNEGVKGGSGLAYCTTNYNITLTGATCTLPCPTHCPSNMDE